MTPRECPHGSLSGAIVARQRIAGWGRPGTDGLAAERSCPTTEEQPQHDGFGLGDQLSQDGADLSGDLLGRPAQAELVEAAAESLAGFGFHYVETSSG